MADSLLAKKKLLGSSSITSSNSITVIRDVRKLLKVKTGDIVAYCITKNDTLIVTSGKLSGEFTLLGSSTVTSSNTVSLPKKIRDRLNVQKKDKIAYYLDEKGNILLET